MTKITKEVVMKSSTALLFCSLCAVSLSFMNADQLEAWGNQPEPAKDQICGKSPQHMRVSARYTSMKGVGYNEGYTTLETFLSPWNAFNDKWLPFVDGRGHIFDNGKWAANAGLGVRYLSSSRVWGINSYYDYRNTSHRNYNQVSVGLETLGTLWDFRINGYLPVGKTHTHLYDTKFKAFEGHSILVSSKRQFAMKGINAEAGFHVDHFRKVPLYFATGPYYLTGKGASTWGGEFRVRLDLLKHYVRLEGNTSYDHFFKWTGQGQISVNIPFGGKSKVKKRGENCRRSIKLSERVLQPVDRNEIIPVGKQKVTGVAIDPATGQPFNMFFVSNLSHSAGTYESPFSTLADAQSASSPNDIIYVYPGNLTSMGQSSGITLKDGQQLLGATFNHSLMTTLGLITLPAQAAGSNAPILTNGSGAVVTLANNNVVSGLYIQNTAGAGILASGSNNATLTQNYIQGVSTTHNGIELDNVTGTVNASSNTIMYQGACVNINNTNPVSNASYLFTNNMLQSVDGDYGINIAYTEGSNNRFLSANNNLLGSGTAAINITSSNATSSIFNISDCTIGTEDSYAVKIVLNNDSTAELNIENSVINSYDGVYTTTNNQSQLTSTITNNAFNVYEDAFEPETHNTSTTNATFTNNSINCYDYAIYIDTLDASTLAVNISDNTMSCYEYAIYSDLAGTSTVSGTISNNTINALYDATYTDVAGSSHFAADINNNVISSAYYHLDINTNGSSTYSGNVIGNTFIGQDNDDTLYWTISSSGNVTSTIADNVFTGNYSAIDLENSGTGTTTIQVLNNTIKNSSTTGIFVTNSGTTFQGTISGNTFQGFGTNAVDVGNSAGTMCLKLNNNTSYPYPNAYVIGATGGTVNLVTPEGNSGQIVTTGVTPVSQCP